MTSLPLTKREREEAAVAARAADAFAAISSRFAHTIATERFVMRTGAPHRERTE